MSVNKYDDFYRNLLLVLRRLYYVLHSDFSVARGLFVSQVINKLNKVELGGYSFSKYRFFLSNSDWFRRRRVQCDRMWF